MVSAWRKFINIFSRPLFTIIFRPEMLKFHPYSILTGDTMVGFVIFCVLIFLYLGYCKFQVSQATTGTSPDSFALGAEATGPSKSFLSQFCPYFWSNYHNSIQILSRLYPDFIQILSRFYPASVQILSSFVFQN